MSIAYILALFLTDPSSWVQVMVPRACIVTLSCSNDASTLKNRIRVIRYTPNQYTTTAAGFNAASVVFRQVPCFMPAPSVRKFAWRFLVWPVHPVSSFGCDIPWKWDQKGETTKSEWFSKMLNILFSYSGSIQCRKESRFDHRWTFQCSDVHDNTQCAVLTKRRSGYHWCWRWWQLWSERTSGTFDSLHFFLSDWKKTPEGFGFCSRQPNDLLFTSASERIQPGSCLDIYRIFVSLRVSQATKTRLSAWIPDLMLSTTPRRLPPWWTDSVAETVNKVFWAWFAPKETRKVVSQTAFQEKKFSFFPFFSRNKCWPWSEQSFSPVWWKIEKHNVCANTCVCGASQTGRPSLWKKREIVSWSVPLVTFRCPIGSVSCTFYQNHPPRTQTRHPECPSSVSLKTGSATCNR